MLLQIRSKLIYNYLYIRKLIYKFINIHQMDQKKDRVLKK